MEKLDLKREFKELFSPAKDHVEVVEVPPLNFAMIDGEIGPGEAVDESEAFQRAVDALYGVSYGLKFQSKGREEDPVDYTVMPLEGLWWTPTSHQGFDSNREEPWFFTALICQPEHITEEMFNQALEELHEKKGEQNPSIRDLRFERWAEGLSMQIMHIGPYSEEMTTIAKMDAFAAENGYRHRGKHHEIYLGDPRRAKPENLRTILRHPIEPIG